MYLDCNANTSTNTREKHLIILLMWGDVLWFVSKKLLLLMLA